MKTFAVQLIPPTALKPYWRNNKIHDRAHITALVNAIRRCGFDQPIVVDKDLVIIKGHGRRIAALELRLEYVPVVVRDDLTPTQVQASRIADNRSFSMSGVDKDLEHNEILDFVSEGGKGGELFFDFLKPNVESLQFAATSGHMKTSPDISGTLQNCPKCHFTFMEAEE